MDEDTRKKLWGQALEYKNKYGLSVIPLGRNKRPVIRSYNKFKERHATDWELDGWFSRKNVTGIGIICGPVSENLVVADFDDHWVYEHWTDVEEELAEALPTVMSGRPEGGLGITLVQVSLPR